MYVDMGFNVFVVVDIFHTIFIRTCRECKCRVYPSHMSCCCCVFVCNNNIRSSSSTNFPPCVSFILFCVCFFLTIPYINTHIYNHIHTQNVVCMFYLYFSYFLFFSYCVCVLLLQGYMSVYMYICLLVSKICVHVLLLLFLCYKIYRFLYIVSICCCFCSTHECVSIFVCV